MNKRSLRRCLTALALALSVPAALAASAATASASPAAPAAPRAEAPPPSSCTPTLVKSAELVKTVDGPAILVSGLKFHADSVLSLDAQDIQFIKQPDYFPYDVNECGGTGRVVKTPYTELFRVPTFPVGRFGIQIGDFLIDLFPHTA